MNKYIRRILETKYGIMQTALALFGVVTLIMGKVVFAGDPAEKALIILAIVELAFSLVLFIYFAFNSRARKRELETYIRSLTYDSENAKNKTLLSFPMPIAVFRREDTSIVWGNDAFFEVCGDDGYKLDAKISELVPGFSSKWIVEGKSKYPGIVELNGKKYKVHGNMVMANSQPESGSAFLCITYWIDVTDYENLKVKHEDSLPIAGVIVIDNYEEMIKSLPDRDKNDVRDSIEDRLSAWAAENDGIVRRYDRDRYIMFIEKKNLVRMKKDGFPILGKMHEVESPNGTFASIAVGYSEDTDTLHEAIIFADKAAELALTRGGDQVVIKNKLSFEFYGGRGGGENEKRTKIRSRVMAKSLSELVEDSSKVYIMGHRMADLDSIGAAAGVCALCRKHGVKSSIVIDDTSACFQLVSYLKTDSHYAQSFIDTQSALVHADGRTLLVIVDTNRPEQVEEPNLLDTCNRVAVIDHHRAAATYIHNAVLGFIDSSASSCCEIMSEVLSETVETSDLLKVEANALLAGIVLDTKNFTMRTNEATFDAASYLKHCEADSADVKKLLQSNMEDTIKKYRILQSAETYKDVIAIASPDEVTSRVVAAKAADELLNISGVEASFVIALSEAGGTFVSARSIGELNVQLIMEKLGGGGNRSAAAAQFSDKNLEEAVLAVKEAIDEYLG